MIKYLDLDNAILDRETGRQIPKEPRNRHYQEFQEWVAAGNTAVVRRPGEEYILEGDSWIIDPTMSRAKAIAEINSTFQSAIKQPVTCIDNDGKEYQMDADEESSVRMRRGIEFAELADMPTMNVVDYHNQVHEDVSLENCKAIMLQQAASFFAHYMTRATARANVLNN